MFGGFLITVSRVGPLLFLPNSVYILGFILLYDARNQDLLIDQKDNWYFVCFYILKLFFKKN
jgi:hypothetical protein